MKDRLGEAHERDVPASVRHGRGQYFTPFPLIQLVLELCGDATPTRVLDPACGSGRFLLAARERWPDATLLGFETDPQALDLARQNLPAAELHGVSFLEAEGAADLLVGNPPYVRRRGKKRDLYVDFLEAAPRWLAPGGRVALVLSSAWLDVEYGAAVRSALQGSFAVEWIVEGTAERWFPGAKVNTMVLVARREPDAARRAAQEVRFAAVHAPLPAAPTLVRAVPQADLGEGAWGPWLRAPDAWLRQRGAEGMTTLGALATVRRGWTTNDNGFYYPPPDAGIDRRWLRPLLKSPKRVHGVRGRAADLPDRAFVAGPSALEDPGAAAWIGDRERWTLRDQPPTRQVLMKGYGDRFRQPRFDEPVHYDQQIYGLEPADGVDGEALAAVLHSSWFGLTLELLGRVNFGDGVLWLGLRDARSLPVPDLRGLGDDARSALVSAFEALPDGRVPRLHALDADPAWGPAQARLDDAVAALLGLAPDDDAAVRAGWRDLCARRQRKARTGR